MSAAPFSRPAAPVTPATELALVADAHLIGEEEFIRARGDPAEAGTRMIARLKTMYGISSVTGTATLMKFPPEFYYPPIDGSWDYLPELAQAAVAGLDPEAQDIEVTPLLNANGTGTADDIRNKRNPRYALTYRSIENGQLVRQVAPDAWAVTPQEFTERALRTSRGRQAGLQRQAEEARQRLIPTPVPGQEFGTSEQLPKISAEPFERGQAVSARRDFAEAVRALREMRQSSTGMPMAGSQTTIGPYENQIVQQAKQFLQNGDDARSLENELRNAGIDPNRLYE
jgi:hypothetical protein